MQGANTYNDDHLESNDNYFNLDGISPKNEEVNFDFTNAKMHQNTLQYQRAYTIKEE